MSLDLQSIAASYEHRKAAGNERAAVAHARALVRRAAKEGLAAEKRLTVKELQAEIKARNEGRDDAAQIKPASQRRDDLQAALDADGAG